MPSRLSRTRAVALAAGLAGLAAGPAAAATPSAELITRATGPNGWAPLPQFTISGALASDNGRLAVFGYSEEFGAYTEPKSSAILVRDVVKNTTSTAVTAPGSLWVTGASRDEKIVSFTSSAELAPADTDAQRDLYLYDIATGKVALASPGTPDPIDGVIAGGGAAVVYVSVAPGGDRTISRRILATGAVSTLGKIVVPAGGNIGLSPKVLLDAADDGSAAEFADVYGFQVPAHPYVSYFVSGRAVRTVADTGARLSGDGRFIFSLDGKAAGALSLVRTPIAGGAATTIPVPTTGSWGNDGAYISSIGRDGQTATLVAKSDADPDLYSVVSKVYSLRAGMLTAVAQVPDVGVPQAWSRSGRYEVTRIGAWGHLYLRDRTGGTLAGAREASPVSAYANATVYENSDPAEPDSFNANAVAASGPYSDPVRSVKVVVRAGSSPTVLGQAVATPANAYVSTDASLPRGTTAMRIRVTVTAPNGITRTESFMKPVMP